MSKGRAVWIGMVILAVFAAAAQSQTQGPEGDNYVVPAKDSSGQQIGAVDWTAQAISAIGSGVPPANTTEAQGRLMACRAAEVIARRNLLEVIKGMTVTSETQVVNFVTQSDTVRAKVDGIVKATPVEQKNLPDGTCEVTVRLGIHATKLERGKESLADLVLPAKPGGETVPPPPAVTAAPPAASPVPSPVQAAVSTGVVVDARGLGARPAMSPRILDGSGQEIYGSAFVSRDYAVQYGMAGYSRNLEAAVRNERVTNTPLQVKAAKASGAAKADLVLSEEDAAKLRAAGKTQSFLAQARVMIVLD